MSYERAVSLREAGDVESIKQLFREYPEDGRVAYQVAWTHDRLGLEAEAVQYYRAALQLGLPPEEEKGAFLGLGSTLRCLNRLQESLATFESGLESYPGDTALRAFRALTYHNLGRDEQAVSSLIKLLVETTGDSRLQSYSRALSYYADDLDPLPDPAVNG